MKIAYFINQYPKVSHTFIKREILALEKQGINVQRIALRGWDEVEMDASDKREQQATQYVLQHGLIALVITACKVLLNAPFRFVVAFRLATQMGVHADRSFIYHWFYLLEACQVLIWLKQSGAQHVHAHFGTNSAEVVMLANALGGPSYSFTVHGPEEFDKPQFLGLAEKIVRSSFVVAISSFGQSQLYRWIPYKEWQKVKIVHCGLDADFFAGEKAALPVTKSLVCVGRLCEQKGQLLLIEALHKLVLKGEGLKLVLAGDGEMRPEIERLIKEYHLGEYVRITGWISSEQVRQELLATQGLVLASFAEGLPVVLMEAMSLYRPVLTTYVAGIPELVRHKKEGLLFEAGSAAAIAETIQYFFALSTQEKEAMGQAGHDRVFERHHIDVEADKLIGHFTKALTSLPIC